VAAQGLPVSGCAAGGPAHKRRWAPVTCVGKRPPPPTHAHCLQDLPEALAAPSRPPPPLPAPHPRPFPPTGTCSSRTPSPWRSSSLRSGGACRTAGSSTTCPPVRPVCAARAAPARAAGAAASSMAVPRALPTLRPAAPPPRRLPGGAAGAGLLPYGAQRALRAAHIRAHTAGAFDPPPLRARTSRLLRCPGWLLLAAAWRSGQQGRLEGRHGQSRCPPSLPLPR
jgi:hypothetical protein